MIVHQSVSGHTPRLATQPPQPVQEDVVPETEPIDVSISDNLPDVIDVPEEEFYSDLALGSRGYSDMNGEMPFEFGQ